MLEASTGSPLQYGDLEHIGRDTPLRKGEYYIFRKNREDVLCNTRAVVERALDPVGIKEDFLKKMKEDHNETPIVYYVKLTYVQVHDLIFGKFLIEGYTLEMHMKDTGAVTAAVIIAVAIAVVIIGAFLVASWLIYHALDVLPPAAEIPFIIFVLLLLGILAVVFLGGGIMISKRKVKVGK